MSMFSHHSPRTRHLIALSIACGIGTLLIGVMLWWYMRPSAPKERDAAKQIGDFYTTILNSAQSYFGGKSDTIE